MANTEPPFRKRILVIEDKTDKKSYMDPKVVPFLRGQGFEVIEAKSYEEGKRIMEKEMRPDAVILQTDLGRIDLCKLTERLGVPVLNVSRKSLRDFDEEVQERIGDDPRKFLHTRSATPTRVAVRIVDQMAEMQDLNPAPVT